MKKHLNVAGIGELLWDMLPSGKQPGGAPFNFAFHARQLGCESHIISAVGKDELAMELKDIILRSGLTNDYLQENDYPTSTVSIILDDTGQPDYTIHENVAWDHIEWNQGMENLASQLDAVCFGSLAQRNTVTEHSIQTFLNRLPANCMRVFDVNLRQNYFSEEIIFRSLGLSDVLKLNENELPVISGYLGLNGSEEAQLQDVLKKFDLTYVIYTMGSKGSLIVSDGEASFVVPPKINVVDTVGAGDAFTATFITGALNELPLKEVHEKANEVAAFVCTQKGATPRYASEVFE